MQSTKQINEPVWAVGLMSGTSLDGIDAALVKTDGIEVAEFGATHAVEYTTEFRAQLKQLIDKGYATLCSNAPPYAAPASGGESLSSSVEAELTMLHAKAVEELLGKVEMQPAEIEVIGFHGQTIWHRPEEGKTCQIGDGALLAKETGIAVVNDFRSNDMVHGGQGAPLVPVFHQALMRQQPKPVAVLNIGGVANVTWIGEDEEELIAFDTGPGNALINDWVMQHASKPYDKGGKLAAAGRVDKALVAEWLRHEYFSAPPPKSLDRNTFQTFSSPLGGEQSRPRAQHKGQDVGGKLTQLARYIRKEPTSAEKKLWYRLSRKQLGCRFRRQHPIGKQYIADFVCLEKKLIIELDGSQHISQASADNKRTAFLEKEGYRVLRFWNNDVFENIDGVLEMIWQALTPHASSDASDEACSQLLPPKGGAVFVANGAATLTEFTVQAVVAAKQWFSKSPAVWYVTGGGVHNDYMMQRLQHLLEAPVKPISALGYDSDMLEAQAFAYLAVRSMQGLPLTFPNTTGVENAVSGGYKVTA